MFQTSPNTLSAGSFVPVSKIFKSNDCNGEKTTRIARAPFEEASLSILLMINAQKPGLRICWRVFGRSLCGKHRILQKTIQKESISMMHRQKIIDFTVFLFLQMLVAICPSFFSFGRTCPPALSLMCIGFQFGSFAKFFVFSFASSLSFSFRTHGTNSRPSLIILVFDFFPVFTLSGKLI